MPKVGPINSHRIWQKSVQKSVEEIFTVITKCSWRCAKRGGGGVWVVLFNHLPSAPKFANHLRRMSVRICRRNSQRNCLINLIRKIWRNSQSCCRSIFYKKSPKGYPKEYPEISQKNSQKYFWRNFHAEKNMNNLPKQLQIISFNKNSYQKQCKKTLKIIWKEFSSEIAWGTPSRITWVILEVIAEGILK